MIGLGSWVFEFWTIGQIIWTDDAHEFPILEHLFSVCQIAGKGIWGDCH
jgi:hypothetical protein